MREDAVLKPVHRRHGGLRRMQVGAILAVLAQHQENHEQDVGRRRSYWVRHAPSAASPPPTRSSGGGRRLEAHEGGTCTQRHGHKHRHRHRHRQSKAMRTRATVWCRGIIAALPASRSSRCSACVCVCMHVRMLACTRACMCACLHVRLHAYVGACMCACLNACMRARAHTHTHTPGHRAGRATGRAVSAALTWRAGSVRRNGSCAPPCRAAPPCPSPLPAPLDQSLETVTRQCTTVCHSEQAHKHHLEHANTSIYSEPSSAFARMQLHARARARTGAST